MIYWLFILTLVVEIFLYIKTYKLEFYNVLEIAIPFTGIIIFILTIFIIGANIQSKPEKYALESSYNTLLEYKSAQDSLQNEHYISDIISWNTTISSGKAIQRDFWVGIFIPNIYDDFDFITLKGGLKDEKILH